MKPANVMAAVGLLWMGCLSNAEPVRSGGGVGARFLPKNIPPPIKDATTNEELRDRQKRERFGGVADPRKNVKTYDLVSTSTFIQWGKYFTVLPKGSVLHAPEHLRSWIVEAPSPEAKFRGWEAFLREHRGSVFGFNVTLDQAGGKEPINEEELAIARKRGLVVALLRGSPVSVVMNKSTAASLTSSDQP